MRKAEFVRKLLEPDRLLHRVQRRSLEVFHKGEDEQHLVADVPDECGDAVPAEFDHRAEPSFPGDQLVPLSLDPRHGTDHDGLEETVVPDRGGEFGQFVRPELSPRLEGIRDHTADGKRPHIHARARRGKVIVAEERLEPASEPVPGGGTHRVSSRRGVGPGRMPLPPRSSLASAR